jgi:ribosomal protein S18 acetylase RimI-like enzyme
VDRSARRADYLSGSQGSVRSEAHPMLDIRPCETTEQLSEIVGALRKLKHEKSFIHKIFEGRDKQSWPRDLLAAYVQSKKGKPRAVGVLRRSLRFDKATNRKSLSIDFVWVMPEFRSCGCGRALMAAGLVFGKPKDVWLQVAGSDDNKTAVDLYKSLGFEWDEESSPKHTEMLLLAERVPSAVAAAQARLRKAAAPPSGTVATATVADAAAPPSAPAHVGAELLCAAAGPARLALRLRLGSLDRSPPSVSAASAGQPLAQLSPNEQLRTSRPTLIKQPPTSERPKTAPSSNGG